MARLVFLIKRSVVRDSLRPTETMLHSLAAADSGDAKSFAWTQNPIAPAMHTDNSAFGLILSIVF